MGEEGRGGRMERERQRRTKDKDGKRCIWLCVCVRRGRQGRANRGKKNTEMRVQRESNGENKYVKTNREGEK